MAMCQRQGQDPFHPSFLKEKGFPGGSDSKESAHNAGDPDLIPESGRSPEKGVVTYSMG